MCLSGSGYCSIKDLCVSEVPPFRHRSLGLKSTKIFLPCVSHGLHIRQYVKTPDDIEDFMGYNWSLDILFLLCS
jgi:hypothetical protein